MQLREKSTFVFTSSTSFYFLLVLQVQFSESTFSFTWVAFSRVTSTFTQVQNKCTCYSSDIYIICVYVVLSKIYNHTVFIYYQTQPKRTTLQYSLTFSVTYDVKVKLPQEHFVAEMRDPYSASFKHVQKKYCDAVSVYLLFSLFSARS